ncbi:molybdopterin-dependent oxidoreductase [Bradyrhizobium sp. U87765 SZCCT0131]|uniref:molybdopterin cofactor-binding domain-containing protein n=1 Tax=unclassified Bradyrhizobium TaxID=2631580 RepID=UPI001BA89F5A|nr:MULTISPECIES: molybdopterin cofactor-binding domain-containing protein [unclassified Bradyrhizobium]MBR1218473.1 molybdopterin-dependent oxidoreductase [Bradyrhizobium sp. U87765 SZCCT0131]MBR1260581.1 molybdopterin-dependent oxidoreductase [Bradyrhizobium sp. U87765 SZCCT0134]MBR1303971.1 molybdopterin-dependent oxidoreductase [Bradyrhizobium sp. U87765 SZCCT0110]MBR1319577.1 molybdopterin-dependent oxidoreductase [Bradyrhizobium sp. U87765 SZCCT0109]MBR1347902.1 molybdopterin-dependent ox
MATHTGDQASSLLDGTLSIVRTTAAGAVETFITLAADGTITAFNGHVDLGTGIRTALAQIVAEELDVAVARVTMVLGDTSRTPNQGATIASETIQITAIPLRRAAAQARQVLLTRAAARFELSPGELTVEDGLIRGHNNSISYGELIAGEHIRLELDNDSPVKAVETYSIVGQPVARVDIPAKVTGEWVYVHDVRVPGMLHGRVVRPPYAGLDAGEFVGTSLLAVDETSIRHLPGIVAVVRIADFVGVVAEREENAIKAAEQLEVSWKPLPAAPNLDDIPNALRANPSTPRTLLDKGDVQAAMASATRPMPRTYVWPYHMHGSIGPSCAVADVQNGNTRVWSGTQNPHILRADLALLLGQPEQEIDVIRMEAAGCYGRNCADDVAADAVLLSRAVGRPVRVQLTRAQEHAWEPKGTAQLMEVNGGLDADGGVAAYDFSTRYPSNGAPTLALLLTGTIPPQPAVFEMGDRTAIPPYDYDNSRVTVHDMPPIMRASWMRGVSALPNTFAHESYIDELATEAGVDPIAYRLRYLKDPRAVDLVKAVAKRANWVPRPQWTPPEPDGDVVRGRGFAYALYVHSKFPGYGAAWSAWIADVAVNKTTGDVSVVRVVAGQDSGLMINPDGVRHQIHGNVIQSTSRALKEEVSFDRVGVASKEWGAYPLITFPEVPEIDVLMLPRPDQPPLGVGESASVPSAAAIANAIFDATGVRFREPPFTPERILRGLYGDTPPPQPTASLAGLPPAALAAPKDKGPANPFARRRGVIGSIAAACTAAIGVATAFLAWTPAIAPIARPDASVYSAATIARGEQLAALGACAVCHTGPGGAINAGGHALETPFGTVYSTNITPDVETGIGTWSYPAFARAMREGIHRDGRRLYPAFPYNHFARTSDADLQALYAYLMAQPAVRAQAPETKLAFPFSVRPLLAGWNALFHDSTAFMPKPDRSVQWNRGAYLVEGLGHCAACHSPRNALGAERTHAYLAGGVAEGWEAPALTSLSHAPIPWSEDELYAYLRTGASRHHGVAAGPMAPVVKELAVLPDADIRAMAVYLASFNDTTPTSQELNARAAALETATAASALSGGSTGARIYQGACAVCHQVGGPPLFGARPSLALNSNVHSTMPDNLIQVILHGIAEPAHRDLGTMPAFADHLNDAQVAELVGFLRRQFAPDKPKWQNVEAAVARLRRAP